MYFGIGGNKWSERVTTLFLNGFEGIIIMKVSNKEIYCGVLHKCQIL